MIRRVPTERIVERGGRAAAWARMGRQWRRWPERRSASLVGVLAILALALGLYASLTDTMAWEVAIVRGLQEASIPGLYTLSIAISRAGTGDLWLAIIATLVALLWAVGGARLALLLALSGALQTVSTPLKLLTERARPAEPAVEVWRELSTYSFPSGHVLGAAMVFGFLGVALTRCEVPSTLRRLLQAGCVACIGLMGVARMVVGAHWPTDVLGAYLLAALLLVPLISFLPPRSAGAVRRPEAEGTDGHITSPPADPSETDVRGHTARLHIHLRADDAWESESLGRALVRAVRAHGLAGTIVRRDTAPCDCTRGLDAARVTALTLDLPVVIDAAGRSEAIATFLPTVRTMVSTGLVAIRRDHPAAETEGLACGNTSSHGSVATVRTNASIRASH